MTEVNLDHPGGHGWVVPRPDGARARCGGPAICADCRREQALVLGARLAARSPSWAEYQAGVDRNMERLGRAAAIVRALANQDGLVDWRSADAKLMRECPLCTHSVGWDEEDDAGSAPGWHAPDCPTRLAMEWVAGEPT